MKLTVENNFIFTIDSEKRACNALKEQQYKIYSLQ